MGWLGNGTIGGERDGLINVRQRDREDRRAMLLGVSVVLMAGKRREC